MADLLIELFSEEIPARMQPRARDDLRRLITDGLVEAGLTYESAGAFSTPRRLALAVEGLSGASRPVREERKGPRTDAPDKAIEGFLRSTGLTRDQLERRTEKKGEVVFAVIERPGRPAAEIVAEVLDAVIRDFPWPKSMRWGAGNLRWVRPLHSILCILTDESGAQVVPLTIDGISAGDTTRGHRFMAPDAVAVTGFDDYDARLRRAKVMLDPAEREQAIRQEAGNLAFARGWEIVADEALMAELAGLVEWPVPLMGVIEDRFLDLPPEVLQTSMKAHQKFLSARNPATGRIEGFVTVANVETPDHGATILAGNQRVLAARLSDAVFFFESDMREVLADVEVWKSALKKMTFHQDVGSQWERVQRMMVLSIELAARLGLDQKSAQTAAGFSKFDLVSRMVREFPELQGIMGSYYFGSLGLSADITSAIRDHYLPHGADDALPEQSISQVVALADRFDLIAALWATGERPSGSKDPFGMRRAALGAIRIILAKSLRFELRVALGLAQRRAWASMLRETAERSEEKLQVRLLRAMGLTVSGEKADLLDVLREAADTMSRGLKDAPFQDWEIAGIEDLLGFIHDRLKVHLRDQGVRHDVIDAVLAMPGNDDLVLLVARATALNETLGTDDGTNLLQGLKRAANILSQAEEKDGVEYSFGADPKFADTDEERALFAALDAAEPRIRDAVAAQDFPAAMSAIAALRAPIDAFFEAVQVNSDNSVLRRNRLNLLNRIRETGRLIADFGRVEG
ncbi:glycine--tRNA ligase subunit beta [uncultured Paracoccus sp.]|uniref:glycine--tRNA ligase subunit beta n=1 Tax=uncultured Paracoccus sp. TaxID=189685 RepID=UPI002631E877|nr:glycine--tRNA ligase subunit beta [uncultured Paracoccus sp.]